MDFNWIKNKLWFKWRKGSYYLLVIIVFFWILDLWSTFRFGPLVNQLEANPLYLIAGWYPVIFANLLFIYIILLIYSKSPYPDMRFMSCSAVVWLAIVRSIVVYNNIIIGNKVLSGELTEEVVATITTEAKLSSYYWNYVLLMLVPIVATLFVYYLFKIDHEIEWKK